MARDLAVPSPGGPNEDCLYQWKCERMCTYRGREEDCPWRQEHSGEEPVGEDSGARGRAPAGIQLISVDRLIPHPDNPRKELGDLTELAESIRDNGILQNLTVVPAMLVPTVWQEICARPDVEDVEASYVVVIGHRRMAAAKLAGLTELPCVIANMTPQEQVRTMLMENMQRADLTPYEQAQGFQMMLDLGESVESIAESTDFSESTVRRRLKMATLDQETLREVSDRQISMRDFDRLAQIEDPEIRNECLKAIGTNNFDREVEGKLRDQRRAKVRPLIEEELGKSDLREIPDRDRYSNKYESVRTVYIEDWEPGTDLIPAGAAFYYLADWGCLDFYKKRERAAPQKKSAEEIEAERRCKEAWRKMREATSLAHKLRADFIAGKSVTTKNMGTVFHGAIMAFVLHASYYGVDRDLINGTLPIPDEDLSRYVDEQLKQRLDAARKLIADNDRSSMLTIVYAGFDDGPTRGYFERDTSGMPVHRQDLILDALYDWLTSLGYVLSDEEQQLRDGTHPLFHPDDGAA